MSAPRVNVQDYQRAATKRLPRIVSDYLEGGALDEVTLRSNTDDMRGVTLRQRILHDVSQVDLGRTVLGHHLQTPFMVAPMGLLDLFHPGADVCLARAAHAAGTVFVHSAWSSTPLATVAAAAPGSVWAQLSFWRNATLVDQHLHRAATAGIDVLVVAGDVSVSSKRERDLHNGFTMRPRPTVRGVLNAARKPWWVRNLLTGPRITFGDQTQDGSPMTLHQMKEFMDQEENDTVTWSDIDALRSRWQGKLVVKGVMTAEDALRAVDAGADGIYVSNHGGRQFDGQSSTVAALPEITAAVGSRVEILVDGGIRRGADAVKLAALGASAVLIGRPAVYGLVTGGALGARRVLDLLTDEAATACAFVGARRLSDVTLDAIRHAPRLPPKELFAATDPLPSALRWA